LLITAYGCGVKGAWRCDVNTVPIVLDFLLIIYVDSVASRALSVLAGWVFSAVSEKYDAWKYPFDDAPKKSVIAAAHRPASSSGQPSARLIDSL
jgi:hypothetical protein